MPYYIPPRIPPPPNRRQGQAPSPPPPKPGRVRLQINATFGDDAELAEYIKRNMPGAIVVNKWRVDRWAVEVETNIMHAAVEAKKRKK